MAFKVGGTTVITDNRNVENVVDVTIASGAITADAPGIDFTQEWSNSSVTYTGIKANITDTASDAASLLMDLQVDGTSSFSVGKSGDLYVYKDGANREFGY